jgi:acyl carrier protein
MKTLEFPSPGPIAAPLAPEAVEETIEGYLTETFLLGMSTEIDRERSLVDAGIVDSTGIVELVSFLEERFAIAIPDEDLTPGNFETVSRIAAYVRRRLADPR